LKVGLVHNLSIGKICEYLSQLSLMRPHVGLGQKMVQVAGIGGFSRNRFSSVMRRFLGLQMKARLQPQMKKYRCPWGLSTANHNILYSLVI
jgi:hypothetical protein